MLTFLWSTRFRAWLDGLADPKARARISARLTRASLGNFGDCEPAGEGVSEMRIDYGPGYRVYLVRRGAVVHVLTGGDKATQDRDIKQAKAMARELRKER